MSKVTSQAAVDLLLKAREESLESIHKMYAMKAHGKIAGMDVFSWVNPDSNALSAFLKSMPFKVIFLATKKQVEELLNQDENGLENIESLVVYDGTTLKTEHNWLDAQTNIACVDSVEDGLSLIHALKECDRVFLYSLPKNNWTTFKNRIEQQMKTWN